MKGKGQTPVGRKVPTGGIIATLSVLNETEDTLEVTKEAPLTTVSAKERSRTEVSAI